MIALENQEIIDKLTKVCICKGVSRQTIKKAVSEGAKDGTVEGYYELQKQNFISSGAVEVDPPVSDYVLLDDMIEAGK